MRLGLTVDALSPHLTGIGRYVWELYRGLSHHPDIEDIAYFRGNDRVRVPDRFLRSDRRPMLRLPKAYRRWDGRRGMAGRLIHGANYFLPGLARGGVITVHDLSVFRRPDSHPIERVRAFEKDFLSSLDRSRHIITDSEFIRQEVIEYFSLSADMVTTVYLGASDVFQPMPSSVLREKLVPIFGPGVHDYILCVGTFEPRKRIETAIRAHGQMCDRTGSTIPLVLVGAAGWNNDLLSDLVSREDRRGRLINLGYVAEEGLPLLYAGARLFLYPSAYEGFGLPPIEAMRSGTPAIVAEGSCLGEVTRGAALLVNPDDIDSFSDAIERVLQDEGLAGTMREDGLTVSRDYRWSDCVAKTVAVYKRVVEGVEI